MITMNTENGWLHACKSIFAVLIPLIPVVISSNITEDNQDMLHE